MPVTYHEISKEIGYIGRLPYPSKERVKSLFHNLCSDPNIQDYKTALRLYRFMPEARTKVQVEMVYMVDLGLAVATESLYLKPPRWSFKDELLHQFYKWIPSLSLFYMFHLIIGENRWGLI